MALKDIKARVKAVIEGVANIGPVYDRTFFAREHKDVAEKMVDASNRLNVWMVSREANTLEDRDVNRANQTRHDTIVVHGFFALDDGATPASEETFDGFVDSVLAALNTDRKPASVGGTMLNSTVKGADAPFLRRQDLRHFGPKGALCHHAEIVLRVDNDL